MVSKHSPKVWGTQRNKGEMRFAHTFGECFTRVKHLSQKHNSQAKESHTKTRIQMYLELGIDVDKIKSRVQTE